MKINHMLLWATGLLVTGVFLTACKKDLEEAAPTRQAATAQSDTSSTRQALEAYPGQNGIVKAGTFRGVPITYEEINGEAVWQGDIILSEKDLAPVESSGSNPNARSLGIGRMETSYRWKNSTIPYEIGYGANAATIQAAIAHWEAKTPLQFVQRTNQTDYVQFIPSFGNASSVGRQGGKQYISLQTNASVGMAIHEIGHAVGLFHEHSRSDRDEWITFHDQNAIESEKYQFSTDLGFKYGPFDFNSIMLFGSYQFSKNGQPTLTRKDGSTWVANTMGLSAGDIATVISMYSNIYIVQNDILYAISPQDGSYSFLSDGWPGTAKIIAEDGQNIMAIQGGWLYSTNRYNGKWHPLTGGWEGAVGITGSDPQGYWYAQQGTRLWKIDVNGNYTRLGGVNGLENWSGTQAVYYHNNALYVIWHNTLYKINTTTGLVDKQYGGNWHDVNGIATVSGSATDLYCMLGNELWKINTLSGQIGFVNGGWTTTTGMTGVGGKLYFVSGDNLYKMNENGNIQFIIRGFGGTTSMGATRSANL